MNLDDLEDPAVELVPTRRELAPRNDAAMNSLRRIEDELFVEVTKSLRGVARFGDIEPDATEPPEEWVEEMGEREAMRQFRMARYATMNRKEAPIGLTILQQTQAAYVRAKAAEKGGTKIFNMQAVVMPGAAIAFPEFEELPNE